MWATFFYRWYRDNPRDHPSVNAAELALLQGSERLAAGHANVPWGKLLRTRSIWLLWLQYFVSSFSWYFNITWLPTYLQQHWKLSPGVAAQYAILPLFFGGVGALFCGSISASFARRVGLAQSRRILATSGFLGAAIFLTVSLQFHDPRWAMLSMGMASFCNDLAMPPSWAACMDIGGKYARNSVRIDEYDGKPGGLRVARGGRLHFGGNWGGTGMLFFTCWRRCIFPGW